MIPLVLNSPPGTPESILSTYLDLYLQEEVTSEGVIRNLDAFARFLEAASFSHGQLLSASDVARDAGRNQLFFYPEATCTLLYRGTDSLRISEHCRALPVEQFLRQLTPNDFSSFGASV